MSELQVRRPVVAGQFYPGSAAMLKEAVQGFLDDATLPEDLGRVRAVVAPHAGYIYSGPTAGYAFKALSTLPQNAWTVFLLGPSHRVPFSGVALGVFSAFRTPLGDVPVDQSRLLDLQQRAPMYVALPQAHGPEHSLEVEVPFLQAVLPEFNLVPMLFGEVDPLAVGDDLADVIEDDDVIVVSSDLSHYHSDGQAKRLDRSLLESLLAGEMDQVSIGEACGRMPIVALMRIAEKKGWKPHVLDYRTSGDTAGSKAEVVGYGAVAYTE